VEEVDPIIINENLVEEVDPIIINENLVEENNLESEESEEVDVVEKTINGILYYMTNDDDRDLYSIEKDGSIGNNVGKIILQKRIKGQAKEYDSEGKLIKYKEIIIWN
jgi:hypothetical protein